MTAADFLSHLSVFFHLLYNCQYNVLSVSLNQTLSVMSQVVRVSAAIDMWFNSVINV